MLPAQLKPQISPRIRPRRAPLRSENLAILQQIPLALLPSLLNEVVGYDWKLPAERRRSLARCSGCTLRAYGGPARRSSLRCGSTRISKRSIGSMRRLHSSSS
jgi:hypothetical protein